MVKPLGKNHAREQAKTPVKTLSAYLAASYELQQQIDNGLYPHYQNPKNFPPDFDTKTFEKIKNYLNVLIEDCQKNKKIIRHLKKALSNDSDNL